MTNAHPPNTQPVQPSVYQIRVQGHLGGQWTDWFEHMTISRDANGETTVTGPVMDQAALHGLLKKVRDLGLTLLSITRIGSGDSDV